MSRRAKVIALVISSDTSFVNPFPEINIFASSLSILWYIQTPRKKWAIYNGFLIKEQSKYRFKQKKGLFHRKKVLSWWYYVIEVLITVYKEMVFLLALEYVFINARYAD